MSIQTKINTTGILRFWDSGIYFEDAVIRLDEFAAMLWPGTLLRFKRAQPNSARFEAVEVLSANSPDRHPLVLLQGDLMPERAALEAFSADVCFQEHVESILEVWRQSKSV